MSYRSEVIPHPIFVAGVDRVYITRDINLFNSRMICSLELISLAETIRASEIGDIIGMEIYCDLLLVRCINYSIL